MASIKTNVAYNILLSVSQIIFPLVSFPYATRVLTPGGLGAVSFADSFTQYFILLAALGIPVYGVREVSKVRHDRDKLSKLFSELVTINCISTFACLVIYISGIIHLDRFDPNQPIFFVGCGILVTNIFMVEWFYQGLENFQYIVKRAIVFRLVTVLLIFVVVRSPDDKVYYYGLTLLYCLLSAGANILYAGKFVRFSFSQLQLKRHLKPLFFIFSTTLVISIYSILDTVILGFLTNESFVGYYTVSVRISKFSLAIIGALGLVLIPRLSAILEQKNTTEAIHLLTKSTQYVILFSIPISFGILIMAPELIMLFGGNAYTPAVDSLRVFAFIVVVIGFAQIFSQQILIPLNKEKYIFRSVFVGVFISLFLNFALIPRFKHTGAAVSSLLTEFGVTLMLYYYAQKFLRVRFPVRVLVFSVLSCALFYPAKLVVEMIHLSLILKFIGIVVICTASYFFFQIYIFKDQLVNDYRSLVWNKIYAWYRKV